MAEWEEAPKRNKANLKIPSGWEEAPRKAEKPQTYGSLAAGVGLAAGDFASQALSMIPAGISGLYSGAKEWYKTGSLDKGIEASVAQTQHDMGAAMPSTWIKGYEREMKLPNEIFAAPAEAGTMAMRGIGALTSAAMGGISKKSGDVLPRWSLDKAVDAGVAHIKDPWRTPVQSALEDTLGVVGGYGLTHKGLVSAAKAVPVRGAQPEVGLKAPTNEGVYVDKYGPIIEGPKEFTKYRTRAQEAKVRKKDAKKEKGKPDPENLKPTLALEPIDAPKPKTELEPPIDLGPEMRLDPLAEDRPAADPRLEPLQGERPDIILPEGWEEAPKKNSTNFDDVSDLPFQQIGDFGPAGELTRSQVSPKDWEALKKKGLVQEGRNEDNVPYEYIPAESLWNEREARNKKAQQSKSKVDPEDVARAIERRADAFDRAALDKEESGYPEEGVEYRKKAAELRKQAQERRQLKPQETRPKAEDGTIDYELPEKPLYPTDQRPEVERTEEGVVEDSNRAKEAEAQAIEDAKPKLDEPMEYGLTLEEPDAIRGAERERDRDALYEGRKTFPTEDIDLKLEKAEKDTHLKNKVKELENLEREIKEAKRKAGEEATEGSRVRAGEVGRTKKSERKTSKADNLIREQEKKRDKVAEQVRNRLSNKHIGIDIRVNLDESGRPTLSLYESDSKVKALPEKTEFEVSPKTKELMDSIEFTRDKIMREIERTTPPDMQRSPEVPEQPRTFEKSMGNKERGAVNPEVFKEGFKKIKQVADKGIELVAQYVNVGRAGAVDHPGSFQVMARDKKGEVIGSALFTPEDFSKPLNKETDVFSLDTAVHPEWRDKGIPAEIYKYAAELGNDVVPSKSRSADGRKMWDNFEKRGISSKGKINRQRGAINLGIGDKLDRLLGRARTAEQMRKDLGYDTPPKPQRTKTHADAIRSVLPDENRTVEQFIAEEKKNFESWEDIPDTILNKAIQPNSVGALSYRYNPLIRYMSSKLDQIDNKIKTEKENALWGSGFKQGLRGWSKRVKSDEGARTILDTLPAQKADGVRAAVVKYADGKELIEMGLERPSEQMLRDAGLDDRQIKSANAIYDQFDKGWDRLNELAKQLGLDPIAKRPGYFPSLWEGDYRIFVKDAEGKPIQTFGAQTKWGMDKIAKELKQKHPEYQVSVADASRNKYKMNDTNAFRLALDLLDKDSPEAKILQASYKDIVAHRGFKTHGLEKRGAGGFLGSKEGIQGVKDFERAMDIYFDKMYKFIGEMEKKAELENLKNGMKEAGKPVSSFENTNDFLNEMTANSTGAIKNQVEALNNFVEWVGNKAGIGESSVGRGINNLSGVAGLMWLTTVKFFEVQMLQPVFNLAKAREIKGVLPEAGDPYANFLKAYGETVIPGMASKDTKAGLSWAKQNGHIDAKILDLMGTNLQKGIWAKMVLNELPKHSLGWWEQEAVRTPTFILYNNMLRNVIKEPTERYAQAAALTQKYMINYSRTQSPSVYSKLGLVGDTARPLKQYSHGYAGQLSEYTARAVHDKQYAPLAHFLGIQWTLAGAKGLVALTGAQVAINSLNKYANTDIPTPEEWLLGSGLSDTMTFGPVSTITGQDLSGSLSAPDPTQMGAFPGLDWAGKAFGAGVDLGSKEMQGLDTDAERMKAMQSVTPNQLQGVLEDQFTEPGEGVPNPNNRMIADRGPRTDKERLIRNVTGARALTEASDQAKIRAFKGKGQRLQEQKKHIMAKVLDEATRGEKNFEPLMKKWVDAGGDPAQWEPQIQQYLIDKNLSFINRELMKVEGLSGAEKVKRMEHFKMILEEASIDELVDVTQEFNK